jgi:Amt family ammonium transporter
MTPGLAFFYGGLVRRKNFLAIMMQSFIGIGIVTFIWVSAGYSLAFSGSMLEGLIRNLDWAFLNGVGEAPGPWAPTIPALAHFTYQETFAIITPALITGGFLSEWGALDFAGGMVVHVSASMAALTSVWVVGRRVFAKGERKVPHNIAFVGLGTGLLWFGWFGFNGGSALAANGIAGLACVTPCAGYIPTWSAFIIGLLAGSVCYGAVKFKERMKWDDALDVWAAHGVGGIMGSVALGVFASTAVNAAGADGLLRGDPGFLGVQVLAVLIVGAYSFVVTWLILKIINISEPVRVPDEIEQRGLDSQLHGEEAYAFD